MNNNIDTSRKIERFLTGEMPPDEEQAFRREMENDTRLGREVALEKLMLGSMKRDAVRAPYNHADARSRAVASLLASRGDGGIGGGGASSGKSEEGQGGRRFWGLIGLVGVVVIGVTTWALYPTLIGGSSQTKEMNSSPSAASPSLQQKVGTSSEPATSDRTRALKPSSSGPSVSPRGRSSAPEDLHKENSQASRSNGSTPRRADVRSRDKNVPEIAIPTEQPQTFRRRGGTAPVEIDKPKQP